MVLMLPGFRLTSLTCVLRPADHRQRCLRCCRSLCAFSESPLQKGLFSVWLLEAIRPPNQVRETPLNTGQSLVVPAFAVGRCSCQSLPRACCHDPIIEAHCWMQPGWSTANTDTGGSTKAAGGVHRDTGGSTKAAGGLQCAASVIVRHVCFWILRELMQPTATAAAA